VRPCAQVFSWGHCPHFARSSVHGLGGCFAGAATSEDRVGIYQQSMQVRPEERP
jgi:hypothetical protein